MTVLKGRVKVVARRKLECDVSDSEEPPQKAQYEEIKGGRGVKEKGRAAEQGCEEEQEEEKEEEDDMDPVPPVKRKAFLVIQTDLLSTYFASEIAERHFPSTKECHDFLCLYGGQFPGRTAKDLYDMCRNIIKRL